MVYKSGQIFLPFCRIHACDGRTDRQTDRILIARPRLHSMQRVKNYTTENVFSSNSPSGASAASRTLPTNGVCIHSRASTCFLRTDWSKIHPVTQSRHLRQSNVVISVSAQHCTSPNCILPQEHDFRTGWFAPFAPTENARDIYILRRQTDSEKIFATSFCRRVAGRNISFIRMCWLQQTSATRRCRQNSRTAMQAARSAAAAEAQAMLGW